MRVKESTVKEFINRNVNEKLFTDDKLKEFIALARQGKEIAATKEYCDIFGASLEEAYLAVSLA